MTTKHALAPWITVDYLSKAEIIKSADGKELVMRLDGASVADMQMMAAAPELLDALKNLIDAHDRYMGASRPDATATTTQARAAIAKARGEQA